MTSRNVKIKHTGMHQATVEVDGVDMANIISSYHLHADSEDGPVLVLQFSPAILPEFDGPAELEVTEDLHEALVHLGWAPPPGPDVVEHEVTQLTDPHRVFLRSDGTYRTEPWHVPEPT